jgi:hypothetical protein
MNILSWAALVLLAVYALNGWRRGMVRTVFATFTIIVALAIAVNMSSYVSHVWQNTSAFDLLNESIEHSLFGESGDINSVADQTEWIQALPVPSSLKALLLENNNSDMYSALGISEFKSYVTNYLANLILNALSFVVVFVLAIIALKILAACLNIISHLPVLHSLNKLGGCILGLVNGYIVLWIICVVVTIFSGTELGGYIATQINESIVLQLIYNHNYLMSFVSSLH